MTMTDENYEKRHEKRYTLAEAKLELNRGECIRAGHSYRVVVMNGKNEPESLHCTRCGSSWSILKEAQ